MHRLKWVFENASRAAEKRTLQWDKQIFLKRGQSQDRTVQGQSWRGFEPLKGNHQKVRGVHWQAQQGKLNSVGKECRTWEIERSSSTECWKI